LRAQEASFDIQYGFIKRPTHLNSSHDFAKFETVGHRYADLSEADYGVALLNDCKYGYQVRDGVLDLNLLRSPSYPDPDADIGAHEFTYALLPHTGDLIRSNVMQEAENLNVRPMVFAGMSGNSRLPVELKGEGVVLGAIKKGEKENCWILRLCETRGVNTKIKVTVPGMLSETNLMEWTQGEENDSSRGLELAFTPFEIKTFKYRAC
jgi:alpha-mannosidase